MGVVTITQQGDILASLTASSGTGVQNLLTPDPKEVWVASSVNETLIIDFGAALPIDSCFVGFTNLSPGSTWWVRTSLDGSTYTDAFAQQPIIEPVTPPGFDPSRGRRVHLYAKLPALVSARYVRIEMRQTGGGAPNVQAGVVAVNQCFQPTLPQELGGGRAIIDTGSRERLPGGGFAFGEGVIKNGFELTLGDLDGDEIAVLHAMLKRSGERRPVALVEDPDNTAGLNERVRWCVLDRLERWERRGAGLTRWALRVEDWS